MLSRARCFAPENREEVLSLLRLDAGGPLAQLCDSVPGLVTLCMELEGDTQGELLEGLLPRWDRRELNFQDESIRSTQKTYAPARFTLAIPSL